MRGQRFRRPLFHFGSPPLADPRRPRRDSLLETPQRSVRLPPRRPDSHCPNATGSVASTPHDSEDMRRVCPTAATSTVNLMR